MWLPGATRELASALAHGGGVEFRGFEVERLQRLLIDDSVLVEIDGANRLAVEAGVEELLWIRQLGALGERQPHGILERFTDAHVSVVRPDWNAGRPGGLLPLHLLDDSGVGSSDQRAKHRECLAAPATDARDDGVYLSGCCHAGALREPGCSTIRLSIEVTLHAPVSAALLDS